MLDGACSVVSRSKGVLVEWDDVFEEAVVKHLLGEDPLLPETDLVARGLDSMETMALIVDLEEAYDIVIDDTDLSADTFVSASALWSVVSRSIGQTAGSDPRQQD
jgi:acyl carrier protein